MNALCYTDLQADTGGALCHHQPGLSLQEYRVRKFYKDLHAIYEEKECEALWDLGDTTDDRSSISIPTIDAVMGGLAPFPAGDHLKLQGNHDQYARSGEIHNGLMFASKFIVYPKPDVVSIHEGTAVFCAPYPADHAELESWLREMGHKYRGYRTRILLGHFQVLGCAMRSGPATTGIAKDVLKLFTLSLLGHVHKPQQLASNAYYVGSPFQQNFGEANEAKRVAVVDTHTGSVEWVPLAGYPEYRNCSFDQFVATVKEDEEHRYRVTLASLNESEQFYAHPLAHQAEPVYDIAPTESASRPAPQTWTTADILARFLEKVPPGSRGIGSSSDTVLEFGKVLVA